ncbi:MAG: hypothetical protein FWC43_09070 [Planctomycetaceae bacterium]|nr:hypothetical protein [Planctomycetaceae bacterium]
MKKWIALSLIVACLGCFSLGCGEAKKPEAPAQPVNDVVTPDGEAPANAE